MLSLLIFVLLGLLTSPTHSSDPSSDCLSVHDFMPPQEDFRGFGQDGLQDLPLLCSKQIINNAAMLTYQASTIITPHPTRNNIDFNLGT